MRISVAMATYQGERFLAAQLQSLTTQTQLPHELIVQDDGSSDATEDVVRNFAAIAPFDVSFERNIARAGPSLNFQHAVERCAGDLILLCDQDDVWHPEHVAALSGAATEHQAMDLFVSNSRCTDADGNDLDQTIWQRVRWPRREMRRFASGRYQQGVLKHRPFPGHGMAVRRRSLDRVLPFGKQWDHDGWMTAVIGLTGGLYIVDRELTRYRLHQEQATGIATLSLAQESATRTSLPPSQFDAEADRWIELRSHMASLELPPADHANIEQLLHDKIALLRDRAKCRSRRLARLGIIARNTVNGRYHRVGRGWLTIARDLIG
jgi:glycosyltransferase involved in cell wall biosynthesis